MRLMVKNVVLIGCLIFVSACGKKVNSMKNSPFEANNLTLMMLEKQCSTNKVTREPVTVEIENLYTEFQLKYPMSFFIIPPRYYDYKTPLVINLEELEKKITDLKNKSLNEEYVSGNATSMAIELYYLYQNTMRFEAQKCNMTALAAKKTSDLRPYLEMNDFCKEKEGAPACGADTIRNLSASEATFIEERTIKMCEAFDQTNVNCQAQYNIEEQKKNLPSLVSQYQTRFQKERFEKLFLLRSSHLRFQCIKDDEEIVTMNLKVSSIGWDTNTLKSLLTFVSSMWTRGNFRLAIELVEETGSDVIEIRPTTGGVSYVPDNENRLVYLSQSLDIDTKKKVLAHEFGHVLGFPDCYTEFFDKQTNDFIYYEMGKDNNNIMCSLRNDVIVPDDYLVQLTQNSCVFN